ncbi:MAG: phosphopentomutase, partial [Lachnospiraceae bacterium]|nr:phosphopentomutase [Lachnospiraceae bacterium]
MSKRVIMIVMDSFGIGAEPDADKFGDVGTNTLKSCISSKYFKADNLKKMGFFNIDGVKELG